MHQYHHQQTHHHLLLFLLLNKCHRFSCFFASFSVFVYFYPEFIKLILECLLNKVVKNTNYLSISQLHFNNTNFFHWLIAGHLFKTNIIPAYLIPILQKCDRLIFYLRNLIQVKDRLIIKNSFILSSSSISFFIFVFYSSFYLLIPTNQIVHYIPIKFSLNQHHRHKMLALFIQNLLYFDRKNLPD